MTNREFWQFGQPMCTSFMEVNVDARGAWLEVASDVRRSHVEQFITSIIAKMSLRAIAPLLEIFRDSTPRPKYSVAKLVGPEFRSRSRQSVVRHHRMLRQTADAH